MQGTQRRAGFQAQLSHHELMPLAVDSQRVGAAAEPVQGQHQYGAHPFPERVGGQLQP